MSQRDGRMNKGGANSFNAASNQSQGRFRTNHDLVDLSGEIQGETEKAFRFYDGSKTVWLPKSQVEWDEASKVMTVPEWLCVEKGLV